MTYKIIESGSSGNAVIYHESILVDVGVSYKKLAPYLKNIKLILLTHHHSDHFNKTTIKRMAKERPGIRFSCGYFLADELKDLGVRNIDILSTGTLYDYSLYQVSPISLYHLNSDMTECKNFGWRIFKDNHKTIHMTDTYTYQGIEAKGYDLYALEANYDEDIIDDIIQEQQRKGHFAHGIRSKYSHASLQQANEFFINNKKEDSKLIYLHGSDTYL